MKVENSDIDTDHLDAALQELYAGNVHQQYGELLYIACCVAAGDKNDKKYGVDRLKKLIAHGKKLVIERPIINNN